MRINLPNEMAWQRKIIMVTARRYDALENGAEAYGKCLADNLISARVWNPSTSAKNALSYT